MRKTVLLLLFCCQAVLSAPVPARAGTRLDRAAGDIAGELLKTAGLSGSVAVVPFRSPDGNISVLGGLLADRLTAILIKSGKVTVLDRRYLGRVLGEVKLQLSGLTEQKDSFELGKFTGADFLLAGNLGRSGEKELAITARLIETRTGKIAASARAGLKADEEVIKLYSGISEADTEAEHFFETRDLETSRTAPDGLKVELLLSQESFAPGQPARAVVSVSSTAAVYLYSVDADGKALLLFPPAGDSPLVEAGRPLIFPGEAAEKAGIFLEASLPPGAGSSSETLRVFAVKNGPANLLDGAATYIVITSRLEASGLAWAEDSRAFTIHR